MADTTFDAKIQRQTPDLLVVTSGGKITVESGGLLNVTLAAADPHVAGQVWSNAGVLTVSAG